MQNPSQNPSTKARKPLTTLERSQATIYRSQKLSFRQIGAKMKKNPATLFYFIDMSEKRKKLDPQHQHQGRHRRGTSKLQERQKKLIKKWLQKGEVQSSAHAWRRLCCLRNVLQVSYNTVIRFIRTLGRWTVPRLKTVVSQTNKQKRIEYCQKYHNFDFSRVLFTDESTFELNRNKGKVFHFKDQPVPYAPRRNPNSTQMCWAGISAQGKTDIFFIEGWVDGPAYQSILDENLKTIKGLFGRKKWYWQHDNAAPHKTPSNIEFIETKLTKHILPHPAQSPDLNPIELVWAEMKKDVEAQSPKTKAELRRAILSSWNKIGIRYIRKVIGGLNQRMEKVIEKGGLQI